jgi:hypothetical protein
VPRSCLRSCDPNPTERDAVHGHEVDAHAQTGRGPRYGVFQNDVDRRAGDERSALIAVLADDRLVEPIDKERTVGKSGQRVRPRALFRLRQRFSDDVELARLLGQGFREREVREIGQLVGESHHRDDERRQCDRLREEEADAIPERRAGRGAVPAPAVRRHQASMIEITAKACATTSWLVPPCVTWTGAARFTAPGVDVGLLRFDSLFGRNVVFR